jgi:histidyl-tRNA synthetase
MSKASTKPPSGMRDFLPETVARRRWVTEVITRVYESHGFVPLETPSIERLSTLLGKYGEEGDQLMYRILHRRDALRRPLEQAHAEGRPASETELADLGLRYDLTVPLARVVAQYGELPRFFKRYQIQPVWRADRPGRGRFREFFQCDLDVTGTTSRAAEAEVCAAIVTTLRELGFGEGGPSFVLRLNHRELLRAMIRASGIDGALEETSLVAVDKLDKIGAEGVHEELVGRGISSASATDLLELVRLGAEGAEDNARVLADLRARVDDEGQTAVDDLAEVLRLCEAVGAGAVMRVSPELARGLSYYTGPIFEIAVEGLAGSMGGGGRYDELVGMFGKQSVPAVGFSLGLERILVVMEERDMFPPLRVGPEIVLCWMGIDLADALRVAARLRVQGLRVEVYPETAKLKKQLQYADSPGVEAPWAAILGKSELADGEITIKELETGEQSKVGVDEVGTLVRGE